METFGLLKILTSLLESKQPAPTEPPPAEILEEKIPPSENTEERENAFLKLMERHEKRSKEIDKKR